LIKKKQKKKGRTIDPEPAHVNMDPFSELNRYLSQPRLRREDCPNPVPWWGVSTIIFIDVHLSNFFQHQFEYPVLRLMARDYLAIPATTCIAERSFSLSARTDDPRRRQMKKFKFGALQKLRAGYTDGRLNVEGDIMKKYIGDFAFDDADYIE
jgi:hypothetical protein